MSDIKEINDKISGFGDIKIISKITGYTESYVRKVLNEERKNTLILNVANDLIQMREIITKKYNKEKN